MRFCNVMELGADHIQLIIIKMAFSFKYFNIIFFWHNVGFPCEEIGLTMKLLVVVNGI